MLYNYWQIYYKPSPLNGDRVTVGVIVANPEQPTDFAIRTIENYRSIADIGGPREPFVTMLKKTEKRLQNKYWQQELQLHDATPANIAQYIDFVKANSHGIMQFSEGRPAAGESAQDLVDFLYNTMVREPERSQRVRRHYELSKAAIHILDEFPNLRERVITSPRLVLDDYSENLHFAVVDQDRDSALEITEGFSFNKTVDKGFKQRTLAWTFLIQMLRDKGGNLQKARENRISVPQDAMVTALVEYPRTDQEHQFFSALEKNWRELGVEIRTLETYQSHARELNKQLL